MVSKHKNFNLQKILKVNEILYTIQGESSFAGLPCIIIRLTGCNLRCKYCDTKYAYKEGKNLTVESILKKIKRYNCNLILVTGGEPLIQQNIKFLMVELLKLKYTVLLETNGSLNISSIPKKVIKIMDIKCPGSFEINKNLYSNIKFLSHRDEVKFVISNRDDYEWAREQVNFYNLSTKCGVLFSSVYKEIKAKTLADWILKDNLNVRLNLQIHKIIQKQ